MNLRNVRQILALPVSILLVGGACSKAKFSDLSKSAQSSSQDRVSEEITVPEAQTTAPPAAEVPPMSDVREDADADAAKNIPTEKPAEGIMPAQLPQMQAGGVPGGHFDFDTSTQTYALLAGTTAAHVHEYDDKFNVTGVDFFNMLDPKLTSPADVIATDQTFKIIVANAQLSPGARLTINGQSYLATDWQKRSSNGNLPVFSFSGAPGTQKLTAMAVTFDPTKSIIGQLIPTETSLVRSNTPGPGQTYRAGALTIQMIDSSLFEIDSKMGVASIGSKGLLWEATLFWHAP